MRKSCFIPVLLFIFLIACHRGRVTTIKSGDGNHYSEVKYSGTVSFTPDSSAIEGISPGGYLVYRRDDDYLSVSSNQEGQLSFEMRANGKNLILDDAGRRFIAETVKNMIRLGVRPR